MIPAAAAPAQERQLKPVDEARRDPSWVSFRNGLLNAVETRDRKYIMGILAPDVRTGLQTPRGGAEFRKQWDVDGKNSPLWRTLRSALLLGSAYVGRDKGHRELCAPYLIGKWPPELDPFDNGVAIARDVLVKAEPSSQSATLQVLSYETSFQLLRDNHALISQRHRKFSDLFNKLGLDLNFFHLFFRKTDLFP